MSSMHFCWRLNLWMMDATLFKMLTWLSTARGRHVDLWACFNGTGYYWRNPNLCDGVRRVGQFCCSPDFLKLNLQTCIFCKLKRHATMHGDLVWRDSFMAGRCASLGKHALQCALLTPWMCVSTSLKWAHVFTFKLGVELTALDAELLSRVD